VDLIRDILNSIGIRWQLVLMQLIGFLIVFFVLKTMLFDRIHRVLADRAAEEERRRHAIAAAKKEADVARAKLDARTAEIEKQAYEQTQAEVRAGLKRKSDVVTAALDKAREEVTAARGTLGKSHDQALEKIRQDVVALTLFVAGKAAGRDLEKQGELRAAAEREVATVIAANPQMFKRTGGTAS
jgi:F-type H+-transporting ATPase subunit b